MHGAGDLRFFPGEVGRGHQHELRADKGDHQGRHQRGGKCRRGRYVWLEGARDKPLGTQGTTFIFYCCLLEELSLSITTTESFHLGYCVFTERMACTFKFVVLSTPTAANTRICPHTTDEPRRALSFLLWLHRELGSQHACPPVISPFSCLLHHLVRQEFVDAIGRPFIDGGHLNDETVGYIVAGATVHINRHVREASFQIIR